MSEIPDIHPEMARFLQRVQEKREIAARKANKMPQDYETIDDYERDNAPIAPLQEQTNRRR